MSKQYKAFKSNWIQPTNEYKFNDQGAIDVATSINLAPAFFNKLSLDPASLRHYRINAAKSCYRQLGKRPVLCLSGGVDSQAMIQCWQEAGLAFDIAIMVFKNGLNQQDVEHARLYCSTYVQDRNVIEIPFDIISFLNRESYNVGIKYQCNSPQFAAHFQFFDVLRELGYTGICAGGDAPFRFENVWHYDLHLNTNCAFINYSQQNNFPVIGNFLGHDQSLAWSLAFLTNNLEEGSVLQDSSWIIEMEKTRYLQKVTSYQMHGLHVIPQSQKYTGFELVKDYYGEKHKDGWAFEKKFRYPLRAVIKDQVLVFNFTAKQIESMERNYTLKTLARASAPLPGLANNFAPR
jgi:hypothetical protein